MANESSGEIVSRYVNEPCLRNVSSRPSESGINIVSLMANEPS